jgi:hypothetical protein
MRVCNQATSNLPGYRANKESSKDSRRRVCGPLSAAVFEMRPTPKRDPSTTEPRCAADRASAVVYAPWRSERYTGLMFDACLPLGPIFSS